MTQPVNNLLHEQLCNWLRDNPAPQSTPSSDPMNPMVIAKLFDAFGSATWWVTEYDRVSRLTFGYVTGLQFDEWGSASIDEMAELIGPGGVGRIEVDAHFRPKPFEDAIAQYRSSIASDHFETAADYGDESPQRVLEAVTQASGDEMGLNAFIAEYGEGLLDAVRDQNPPVFTGKALIGRVNVMAGLARKPFPAQCDVVHAMATLLIDRNQPAGIINAEMGTGKTMMAIALAAVCHAEGIRRSLVICPPHLVYKWRREIKETVPNARVWILNGPDTLTKLLQIRAMRQQKPSVPEFFVMGRVRMRLGYHWRPAFIKRKVHGGEMPRGTKVCQCPDCFEWITDEDGAPFTDAALATVWLTKQQRFCRKCHGALWTLMRPGTTAVSRRELLLKALTGLPTIGSVTAAKLLDRFGEEMIASMLADNVYEFINLMDEDGELVFSDRQARRMERAMANTEFSFGQGGYQATEFIKRYLPQGYFGLLVVDEGHEFKNEGSAQGQAFGVLARKCRKTVLLTGTLMGGYADDLFYLLWRLHPSLMCGDGFKHRKAGLGSAAMAFMRAHGVIKDIYRTTSDETVSHRTARGKQSVHRVARAPGFGPAGIMRYVVPITAFMKLSHLGAGVLPDYQERFVPVAMTLDQERLYQGFQERLKSRLRDALRAGDHSLLGVVLNALLAWPDCGFREEIVRHPHRRKEVIAHLPILFSETQPAPKEEELLALIADAKARGRKVLVYTVYTGARDTTSRLKGLIEAEGLSVAVLRATVQADRREDWLLEQVDRGVDVVLTNPELVKTGLDMLEFPTIVFMQSGYNIYTLQQAARRSWRIGQRRDVEVKFLGYGGTAQMACLQLMAEKIAVSQSTSGDMPESGLDVLNQSGDSIEVALARQLIAG